MSIWNEDLDKRIEEYLIENALDILQTDEIISEFKDEILDKYEEKIKMLTYNYDCKKKQIEKLEKIIKDKDSEIKDLRYDICKLMDNY